MKVTTQVCVCPAKIAPLHALLEVMIYPNGLFDTETEYAPGKSWTGVPF